MDKQTLSNYGWAIITVLVLAVMIALATPFGTYVKEGAKSTLTGLFESSENALNTGLNEAGVTLNKAEFGGVPTVGNNTDAEETIVGSITFSGYYDDDYNFINEPVTLTWEELQLPENGDKYWYNASSIDDASIGDYAFENFWYITSITIPDSVTSIGSYAFYCCSLTSITIPNSVTSIGEWAFGDCDSLTSITIPGSITSIGDSAFASCNNLTNITILDGVTNIGIHAFFDCTNLTSITIPESVTSIGDGAFGYCAALTNITIPNGVTSIETSTFESCTSLTSITIPDSVTSIGYYAFVNCTSLTNITIPNSVTSIGEYAFQYCSSLTNITISDSVTSIGDFAFDGCGNLENISFDGTKAQWNAISLTELWKGYGSTIPATAVYCTDGEVAI